ncbi:MAG: dTDP-4-dehydrorhamnose reductase [Bdellovibrionales bacterium]|nr:dTDP-4-dehydrorhamnose reductase [Bdellovibrionales bacterium]
MKVLLFGGEGQLGGEIIRRAQELSFEIVSPVSSEVSITDREQLLFLAEKIQPDLVLNCAAYTAVDDAETHESLAYDVNCQGVRNCVEICKYHGARLIHISTDYVFSGYAREPLREDDSPIPLGVYGKSKLAGEEVVFSDLPNDATVVRTSSLHASRGQNFVNTMLRLFAEKSLIRVVSDQIMCPTWAGWLSEVILDLSRIPPVGLVHACGAGAVSWFDFACEIRSLLREESLAEGLALEPISAADYDRPAPRPEYSVLDCQKLVSILGRPCMTWREGLIRHLAELAVLKEGVLKES